MAGKKILLKSIKNYRESSKKRGAYLKAFEEKMLYRTTKTENPSTTKKLVTKVLKDINSRNGKTKKK